MTISTNVEIPEGLYEATQQYLQQNPDWDQGRIVQAALSLFLMQHGVNEAGDSAAASQLNLCTEK